MRLQNCISRRIQTKIIETLCTFTSNICKTSVSQQGYYKLHQRAFQCCMFKLFGFDTKRLGIGTNKTRFGFFFYLRVNSNVNENGSQLR